MTPPETAHPTEEEQPVSHALKLAEALEAAKRMVDEALPGFDWGRSCLSAHQIQLLNETPGTINRALTAYRASEEVKTSIYTYTVHDVKAHRAVFGSDLAEAVGACKAGWRPSSKTAPIKPLAEGELLQRVETVVRDHFYPGPVAGSTARLTAALIAEFPVLSNPPDHTERAKGVGDWRPISEAPKYMTVLLYWPSTATLPERLSIGKADDHGAHRAPTHFQPLPAPPALSNQGKPSS